jgi:hypothetical protein
MLKKADERIFFLEVELWNYYQTAIYGTPLAAKMFL